MKLQNSKKWSHLCANKPYFLMPDYPDYYCALKHVIMKIKHVEKLPTKYIVGY